MNFASTLFLQYGALAIVLSLVLLYFGRRRYRERLRRLGGKLAAEPWALRSLVWLLALIFLTLALARPRWDYEWREVKHKGTDIIIVLDLSPSMMASDVRPNRLEIAKRSIRDLMARVGGDRVGLVLFSGVAFIQCPLTHDLGSFELFLDQATIDLLPRQGTEIGAALALAGRAFEQGTEAGSQAKTVFLLSDGEDHGEDAVLEAKKLSEQGARVYALGLGQEGSPIPDAKGSFLRDNGGQLIISKPDLAGLGRIAEAGGGQLITLADGGLEGVYQRELAGQGEEQQESREKVWNERHALFSGAAGLLLALELLLRRRGKRGV